MSQVSTLAQLRQKTQELSHKIQSGEVGGKGGARQEDPRFWYPKLDEKKNGSGTIRFLPPSPGADLPWSMLHSHRFKVGNRWYIENCPTTIGGECPVCKANSELWNSGVEANKTVARGRKRQTTYFLNVLVRRDPKSPENEGQVKIFKCGPGVHKMLTDAAKPQFEDEKPVDAFDPWTGADFKLKIYQQEGKDNITYDKSSFDKPAPMGDDAFIEATWKKQHDIAAFANPKEFKSFADLEKKFHEVVGNTAGADRPATPAPREQEQPRQLQVERQAPTRNEVAPPDQASSPPEGAPTDDPLAFFEDIANGSKS